MKKIANDIGISGERLVDIFYSEARRHSANDKEALLLAQDVINRFFDSYSELENEKLNRKNARA